MMTILLKIVMKKKEYG